MHIDAVPNRGSRPTFLLRESYRDGKRVRKRTLANLSALSDEQIDAIRAVLRGDALAPASGPFEISRSQPRGHIDAVVVAMQRLGIGRLLHARTSRERDLVMAMIAARIVAPDTKLATTRRWLDSTLADAFGVTGARPEELYQAMDWLLGQQDRIQKKLAKRHLTEGSLVLYDLSSSYFEGTCCPLAQLGYNRDGKRGKLQVNYGLVTDRRGCPIAVSVHEGSTSDSTTFLPAMKQLREDFGLGELVVVGDRGMIGHGAIDQLRTLQGVSWITALKSVSIRSLVEQQHLQLGLFDERNLIELTHPQYPGERLIACRNPALALRRASKRASLLEATEASLGKLQARVAQGRLVGKDRIGLAVGKVVNQYKVAKHFVLTIEDDRFTYARNDATIQAEAALDGLYVLRTSVSAEAMDAPDCVRNYKALAHVERAFRSLKTVDLKVRPIHHWKAERVRAHIFLCMLAYYVEWHLREAWRPLLMADEDLAAKALRDPVAPAQRSDSAERKARTQSLDDGTPAHSFQTLLDHLACIVVNTCHPAGIDRQTSFQVTTTPNALQQRALDLAASIEVTTAT